MTPLRWIEVDRAALRHNARVVRTRIGPGVRFTAVVKADGYGHGAVEAARAALAGGADDVAVTYLEEAIPLRRGGIRAPILVMGPVDSGDAREAVRHRLTVMVDGKDIIRALAAYGSPRRPVPVHLKVRLGLHRWGVPPEEAGPLLTFLSRIQRVKCEGLFGHVGFVPGLNGPAAERAVSDFREVALRAKRVMPGLRVHLADSAVLLGMAGAEFDGVRVGNLLYGINPTDTPLPLGNPWKAMARLLRVHTVPAGEPVGYGGDYAPDRDLTVGALGVGFSHGLTMEPASRWRPEGARPSYWGWLRGARCPFVGRVGMTHCLVDLSAVDGPRVGEAVQLPLRRTAAAGWEKRYS